jgi:hypothetical protein
MTVLEPLARETLSERIRLAAKRISEEFAPQVSEHAVQQMAQESLEHYMSAPVLDFVPLLVERLTRERLLAGLRQRAG